MDRFSTVVVRVDAFRRADPRLQVFGASHHAWTLGAPLALDAIERIEAEHGVKFPDEHRAFLTKAGAGGAGPYYGLTPLDRANAALRDHVGEVTPSWGAPFVGGSTYDGCVFVSMQGCGYFSVLVLNGAHAGEVWQHNGADLEPEAPSFLAWMETWIDRSAIDWAERELVLAFDADDRRVIDEPALSYAELTLSRAAREGHAGAARALGLARAMRGDRTGALAMIALAAQHEKDEPEPRRHLDLARLARALGDWNDVLAECDRVLEAERLWASTEMITRALRVRALDALDQPDGAIAELDRLAKMTFFDARPHYALARRHLVRGAWADAESALLRAAKIGAGSPPAEKHTMSPRENAIATLEPFAASLETDGDAHHAALVRALADRV